MLEGLRILVAEDHPLLAEMMRDMLWPAGCKVVGPAGSLDEALALAERSTLDGALLDIGLGGDSCFPVAWLLQQRRVPFALLSGYAQSAIPLPFRSVPFLSKPFSEGDLLRTIARFVPPASAL